MILSAIYAVELSYKIKFLYTKYKIKFLYIKYKIDMSLPPKFSITPIDKKVILYKCSNDDYSIIKRLDLSSDMFMCISNIQNEVSLFCYDDDAYEFSHNILKRLCISDNRKYSIFNIHEDLPGIDHIGIISHISSLFTANQLPILYINTFSYNLILVSDEYHEKALAILEKIMY